MKISKKMIAAFVCILLLLGIALFALPIGKKPFKNLRPSEIASATVRLTPPDKTIQIMEMEELAEYLNEVVIYQKDDSYTEYNGQGVVFALEMADGTQREITAYNPFLIMDGVGYQTKYKPCEALNRYANRLLEEEDALVILEEPPALDIVSDETCNGTLRGTYSWQRNNHDGTATNIEADSAHPLDCKELLLPFETTETIAVLRFAKEPDAVLNVRCWSDEHWSDPAADSENIPINGNTIELKPGGYIYEVSAEWDTAKSGYGGIASYSFYAEVLE